VPISPGYEPNIEKLAQLAEETNTILEINANPKRLDLNAQTVRQYPNVKLTINTDLGFALISNMVFVSSANCANFSILGS
jgi:hypothetical protein